MRTFSLAHWNGISRSSPSAQFHHPPFQVVIFLRQAFIEEIAPFVVPVLTGILQLCSASIPPKGGTTNTTCKKSQPLWGLFTEFSGWERRNSITLLLGGSSLAPIGGILGEGALPLNKTCSRHTHARSCLLYGQANPASPSPAIAVSKQQLLTLPKGRVCCSAQATQFREEPVRTGQSVFHLHQHFGFCLAFQQRSANRLSLASCDTPKDQILVAFQDRQIIRERIIQLAKQLLLFGFDP